MKSWHYCFIFYYDFEIAIHFVRQTTGLCLSSLCVLHSLFLPHIFKLSCHTMLVKSINKKVRAFYY